LAIGQRQGLVVPASAETSCCYSVDSSSVVSAMSRRSSESSVPDSPCASQSRSQSPEQNNPSALIDPLDADHPLGTLSRLESSIIERSLLEAASLGIALPLPTDEAVRLLFTGTYPFEPSPWLLALVAARERVLSCLRESVDSRRRAHHHPHGRSLYSLVARWCVHPRWRSRASLVPLVA
jgi:hypothetical protein